ncbi:MAG: PD-(D/E)XK nuclease family transposase [Chlamydiia bacterium]|nr:PD-(D/E)XK nuclease family transposase [Chlamydiia bacterium]
MELKKFIESHTDLSTYISKIKSTLDMWVAFLTRHDLLKGKRLPKKLGAEEVKKALEVLEIMNFSQDEREAYDNHLKWLMIEANTLKKYEEKGKAIGMAEGKAIGIAEGKAIGIAEGMEEGKSQGIESVAIAMIEQQLPDALILSVTGISKARLASLRSKT